MKKLKLSIHWSFFLLGILMIIFGKLSIFLSCLLCAILHEMGHSLVGRKLGYKLDVITLLPYGAMLTGKDSILKVKDEVKIAVAGPIVNLVLIVVCVILRLAFPFTFAFCQNFLWANIYAFCFNLLPIYPLDGGRVFVALASKKVGRARAHQISKIVGYVLTSIIFVLFFVSFFFELNYMLGINALFLLIGLMEEDTSPYYEKLSPFEKRTNPFNLKSVKLDKTEPLFLAYKSISNKKASTIYVMDNKKVIATLKRDEILNDILSYPIDTKLEVLANEKIAD